MVMSSSSFEDHKYEINNEEIKIKTVLYGWNHLVHTSDSVKVDIDIVANVPIEICDSLVVDEMKWIRGNTVVVHSSSIHVSKFGRIDLTSPDNYSITYNPKAERDFFTHLTIPKSTRKMTLIIKMRFLKDDKLSDQQLIEVPIQIERRINLKMIFQGY